ncbi:DNA-3-methyladenine glycosylase [Catalinimonas alkaloidigena]|uniref:DNA-3-methyladenine glycosylase n=1 Tax=Catalinimonas alkaloidigena TaxID=1075417 RepID=UPI001FE1A92C|nr:DNA-3-methyladenine glycosylase [Catalinimonas alkaloidigena]
MTSFQKLPLAFYRRDDVVQIARELLGKYLVSLIDGQYTAGMITETEAYRGASDRACHAFGPRRTPRTELMFGPGGTAYVYLCYGLHHLFNVVTNERDQADAVLIRALEPAEGVEVMQQRRKQKKVTPKLTAGPGNVSSALGIRKQHYGNDLTGTELWIEDRGIVIPEADLVDTPRIGVDYAGDDARLPWRFTIRGNRWVSR